MVARRYEIYLQVFKSILYKPTNYNVFDDFPKINDHFLKISDDFQHVVRRSYECFRAFSELLQSLPKISEEDLKMFRLNTVYRLTLTHSALKQGELVRKRFEIDIFTYEDNMLLSRVI